MDPRREPPKDELEKALSEERGRFEHFYLWLSKSMPEAFFYEVNKEWIFLIVHSLMGFQEQDYFSEIHLKNAAITLCIDAPDADLKILESYSLYGIKNYSTYISENPLPFEGTGKLRIATLLFTGPSEKEEMDPLFLRKLPQEWQAKAAELFEKALASDLCQVETLYEENWQEKNVSYSMHLMLAWKNVPKHRFLYRLAKMVFQHHLVMRSVNASYVHPYKQNSVFLLSLSLHGMTGKAAWESADISDFLQELVTLKFFPSEDLIDSALVRTHVLTGGQANFLRSLMHFIHQVLVNADPNLYSLENIEEGLCRHPELALKLIAAFQSRFHPLRYDPAHYEWVREEFLRLVHALDTGHEYHDQRRKNILLQGMNFISHILKTNFYCKNKSALAFRLDPGYLEHVPFDAKKLFPLLPFGIFYIKGMHYLGFHIRFKDLARGGLRTIFPEKKERMLAERNTIFSECYHLAYTQNKKNKDIPEGGAKGIIFLKPYERLASEAEIYSREMQLAGLQEEHIHERISHFKKEQIKEYLNQTQRSFIQSLLSIINCGPDGSLKDKDIRDLYQKPEYIYLGPDENLHDEMIEWIASESKRVGYKPGGAFISGKPKIGINHKQYGVTSLGVNVYMHEILLHLGINPSTDHFTVKMTGGPDGDVAGNQIMNLYHLYRNTAKLVALTDVSGTIRDPNGLDLEAMANLFKEGKPIAFYPPEKLSLGGFLLDREKRREPTPYIQQTLVWRNIDGQLVEDWVAGNEMNALFRHNVHEMKADIFIPCGGRPRTLRDTNYKEFLDPEGKPTAKAIIEGANLYLSHWARHYLENQGVLIVKDSSANKGGVICSSFEILCSLALQDEEFLANKEALVKEILEKVKEYAFDEASLLIETHKKTKTPMTELSEEISSKINHFTDQLLSYLEPISLSENPKDPLIQCFLSYCPSTLKTKFQDRLLKEIPENHKKAIIATRIAARLVYRKGLGWQPSIVDIFPLILQDIGLST